MSEAPWVNQRVDPTLGRYVASAVAIGLNIVLVIAILGLFGVETTTFAALIAGAGVAIGVAWGGLLGNAEPFKLMAVRAAGRAPPAEASEMNHRWPR